MVRGIHRDPVYISSPVFNCVVVVSCNIIKANLLNVVRVRIIYERMHALFREPIANLI